MTLPAGMRWGWVLSGGDRSTRAGENKGFFLVGVESKVDIKLLEKTMIRARILNEMVPQAVALLDAASRPEIRHQAGKATLDIARMSYAEHGIDGTIEPFIDDVAAAYGWADLVICRAGALTISAFSSILVLCSSR